MRWGLNLVAWAAGLSGTSHTTSRPPRYEAASEPSGRTPSSGSGRENTNPCGYRDGSPSSATEHLDGFNALLAAVNSALPWDESAGNVWPPAVSSTAWLPSPRPTDANENVVSPAWISPMLTAAFDLPPPLDPVVDDSPDATTDPMRTAPPPNT